MPIENVNYFSNCKLNSKYIFDSFVVGPCNKETLEESFFVGLEIVSSNSSSK